LKLREDMVELNLGIIAVPGFTRGLLGFSDKRC